MSAARLLFWIVCSAPLLAPAHAADLVIEPQDQDRIIVDVLSDTHCPVLCGLPPPRCPNPPCADSIACCDTFGAIVGNQNARPVTQDFTYINGDVGINSNSVLFPWMTPYFYGYYNQIQGPKSLGPGNHGADAAYDTTTGELFWADSCNHYAPLNWWEPLFDCDSTTTLADCRRWYSVYLGSPPRVAWLIVSNNSDSERGDEIDYVWCGTPNDGLNHAASPQRAWLNAEIEALPPTIEVVFVAGHRTYYGVERFACRPNIYYSGLWSPDNPETLRTGVVSFLRDIESIYERQTSVKRVFMLSGDQHCFSETVPIRLDQQDDERGVVYLTLGISGGWIHRGAFFPDLGKIPPGTLVHAFQDKWGSARFEIAVDRVNMWMHEAYTDSLIYQTSWLLEPNVTVAPVARSPAASDDPLLRVWPNPARVSPLRMTFRPAGEFLSKPLEGISVHGVTGRRIRQLYPSAWSAGTYHCEWDFRDEAGRQVPAGMYFLRAAHDRATAATAKVTLAP
jgi:hypothetical protein